MYYFFLFILCVSVLWNKKNIQYADTQTMSTFFFNNRIDGIIFVVTLKSTLYIFFYVQALLFLFFFLHLAIRFKSGLF